MDDAAFVGGVQTFGDLDGDTLSYSATGLPPGLSINPSSGLISGTLDSSASVGGPYSVTITADDGPATSQATFILTVANTAPSITANASEVTVAEGATATNTGTFGAVERRAGTQTSS